MPSGIGQTHANALLNADFENTAFTGAVTMYWALHTATPSDTSMGTEVPLTNAYVRLAQTMSPTTFPAAAAGAISLNAAVSFITPTGSWGTVTQASLNPASSGGTQPNWWYDVTTPQTIASGNPVTIAGTFGIQ